jgi:signal peptidase I
MILIGLGLLAAMYGGCHRYIAATFSVPTVSMENAIMYGDVILVNKMYSTPERGDLIVFEFPGNRDQVEPDKFQYYMKRCAALGGDTIALRSKKVFINGMEQPDQPTVKYVDAEVDPQDALRTFPDGAGFTRDNWGPMRVPKKGDVIPLNDSTYYMYRVFIMREGHQIDKNLDSVVVDGKVAGNYTVERDYCFGLGDNRDNSLDSRYWGFIPVENISGRPWMVLWSVDDNGGVRTDRAFNKLR